MLFILNKFLNNLDVVLVFVAYFLIFSLGLVTSFEDIRFGKIKNKWVLSAVLGSLFLALIYDMLINTSLGISLPRIFANNSLKLIELFSVQFLFYVFISVGIAYFLWQKQVWSAADGKLYVAYSSFLPLLHVGFRFNFLIFDFLINVFMIGFVFVIFRLLVKIIYRSIQIKTILDIFKITLSEMFNSKLIGDILGVVALYWIARKSASILKTIFNGVFNGIFDGLVVLQTQSFWFLGFTIFFVIIMMSIVNKYAKRFKILIFVVLIIMRFLFESISVSYLIQSVLIVMLYKLVRSFFTGGLSLLGYLAFSRPIEVRDLKPGMVLADNIVLEQTSRQDKPNYYTSRKHKSNNLRTSALESDNFGRGSKEFFKRKFLRHKNSKTFTYKIGPLVTGKPFLDLEPEGLEPKDIVLLNKLDKQIKFRTLSISETISFAPFLFLGFLLTIIIQGNILILL